MSLFLSYGVLIHIAFLMCSPDCIVYPPQRLQCICTESFPLLTTHWHIWKKKNHLITTQLVCTFGCELWNYTVLFEFLSPRRPQWVHLQRHSGTSASPETAVLHVAVLLIAAEDRVSSLHKTCSKWGLQQRAVETHTHAGTCIFSRHWILASVCSHVLWLLYDRFSLISFFCVSDSQVLCWLCILSPSQVSPGCKEVD